jgi:uncharacterized protein YdhG (YjbR/CyaY superfamily)
MKTTRTRSGKRQVKTVDDFLAALSDDTRGALMKLRKTIKAAVPDAEECISYGIPAFRLGGRFFVGFGASAHHCAFYPGALSPELRKRELKAYDTSRGTIRFQPDKPLPAAMVRTLLKTRAAEYARKARAKRQRA